MKKLIIGGLAALAIGLAGAPVAQATPVVGAGELGCVGDGLNACDVAFSVTQIQQNVSCDDPAHPLGPDGQWLGSTSISIRCVHRDLGRYRFPHRQLAGQRHASASTPGSAAAPIGSCRTPSSNQWISVSRLQQDCCRSSRQKNATLMSIRSLIVAIVVVLAGLVLASPAQAIRRCRRGSRDRSQ